MPVQPHQIADLGLQKSYQFRDFKGMNVTDARTAIDDTEFFWIENFIPIGKGQLALVPGRGANLTTVAVGIFNIWGFTRSDVPYLYSVNTDGSATEIRVSDGNKTTVAAAGVLTTSARLAIWKDTNILIIDPTKGYFQWDGATLTTIDAARLGIAIAVFEFRVWIVGAGANKRQITFTAPNTFSDFNGANGAGSTTLSDSAFPGQIYNLLSAVEQLWIIGGAAVDAITNVTTVSGVTSFSITNVVTNVGSTFPSSVVGFFRTFLFLSPYGQYAIVGATPQKLSDKLDGLFPLLTLGTDQPSAVGTIYNVFTVVTLVTSTDSIGGTGSARPILLCFTQGKWFLATQGTSLKWVTSVVVAGSPQMWGTDGSAVFQLFKDTATTVTYTLKTKVWDFGLWTQAKEWVRVGLEFQANMLVTPSLTLENEHFGKAQTFTTFAQNTLVFIGSGGLVLTFTGAGNNPIIWITAGLVLGKRATGGMLGHYFGLTITGTSTAFTLSAIALQIKLGGEWD